MDVNSDILSFTSVTTEEAEDVERIDAATPSFATSMMLRGGCCLAETFLIQSDDLVDLRCDDLVLERRVSQVAVERSDVRARLL